MDVWKILEMEPTEDKRAIRRAYARLSKNCHPEDTPEKFQVLYSAYQKALHWAEEAVRDSQAEEEEGPPVQSAPLRCGENGEDPASRSDGCTTREEILELFRQQKKEQETKRSVFAGAWKTYVIKQSVRADDLYWEEFLEGTDFLEIHSDPWVVDKLLEEIGHCLYFREESCMKLWEVYGFDKYGFRDPAECEGFLGPEHMRLYRYLLPAMKLYGAKEDARRLKEQEERRRNEKRLWWEQRKRKITALLAGVLAAAVMFLLLTAPVIDAARVRKAAEEYVSASYPDTQFIDYEETGRTTHRMRTVRLRCGTVSDLWISLDMERDGWFGGFTVKTDHFPEELTRRFKEQYGLSSTYKKKSGKDAPWEFIISFDGMDGIDGLEEPLNALAKDSAFCEVIRGLPVFFCPKEALYEEFFMYGGEGGLPAEQDYRIGGLPEAGRICEALRMDYASYLYNYESWRLSPSIRERYEGPYRMLLAKARDAGEAEGRLSAEPGPGQAAEETEIQVREKIKELDLPVATYQVASDTGKREYMTVGNLYLYCAGMGMDVTVHKDGRGFHVYGNNCLYFFGGPSDSEKGVYQAARINIETETAFEINKLSDLLLQEVTGDGSDWD